MTDTLQSESIAQIMPALVKASLAYAPAVKNATNPAFRSRYVDLEGALEAVTPSLLKNEIVLMQQTDYVGDQVVLYTRLVHSSGEWVGSVYPVKPVKQDPQGEGSALTYARRYTAMALCGIAPEDDDGNAATQRPAQGSNRPSSGSKPTSKPAEAPVSAESVNKYKQEIAAAQNTDDLNAVGARLAAANLSSGDKAGLRDEFSKRMSVLGAR